MKKKGQLSMSSAPTVVLLIGLTFLIMATIGFIGEKYGNSMPSDIAVKVVNESLTTVTEKGEWVSTINECGWEDFALSECCNQTDGTGITAGNLSSTATGRIYYTGTGNKAGFNNSNWNCTYSYNWAGIPCEVTADLQTELSNNTPIAGIVLTISLVGIVLTILIGVFLGLRTPRI
jgi:hypothetical protein